MEAVCALDNIHLHDLLEESTLIHCKSPVENIDQILTDLQ